MRRLHHDTIRRAASMAMLFLAGWSAPGHSAPKPASSGPNGKPKISSAASNVNGTPKRTAGAAAQTGTDPSGAPVTMGALPFTLKFEEVTYTTAPLALHSYAFANPDGGKYLLVGGRAAPAGLHSFKNAPANNFPSPNNTMIVFDPANGVVGTFDVSKLSWDFAKILQATNGQGYYDRSTDMFYLCGGYGMGNPDGSNYMTFGALLRFPATKVIAAILQGQTDAARAAAIQPLIESVSDPSLAVTGGELFEMNGIFTLVFGQQATGMYDAFTGNFQQVYTCQARYFQINPNNFGQGLLNQGVSTTSNDYHRRDGNTVSTYDPNTGSPIIGAFGGVFPPGIIGCYSKPVYLTVSTSSRTIKQDAFSQKMSAYNCPTVVAYSAGQKAVYHTFFGGVSHYWLNQTWLHGSTYQQVTQAGRNDGMPFCEDISVLVRKAGGSYKEWIYPMPIAAVGYPPNAPQPPLPAGLPSVVSNLRGSSARFLPDPSLISSGKMDSEGVVLLDQFQPNDSVVIGYTYGGIEAQNPLPQTPNTGTKCSNAVYKVTLVMQPADAVDVRYAHQATGTYNPAKPPAKPKK